MEKTEYVFYATDGYGVIDLTPVYFTGSMFTFVDGEPVKTLPNSRVIKREDYENKNFKEAFETDVNGYRKVYYSYHDDIEPELGGRGKKLLYKSRRSFRKKSKKMKKIKNKTIRKK